jgi:hypothetical protein
MLEMYEIESVFIGFFPGFIVLSFLAYFVFPHFSDFFFLILSLISGEFIPVLGISSEWHSFEVNDAIGGHNNLPWLKYL